MLKFEENLNENFKAYCEVALTEKLEKYDSVVKCFSQFFNSDDLNERLSKKADIEKIDEIVKNKSSKMETEKLNLVVEEVYHRLKHISIL